MNFWDIYVSFAGLCLPLVAFVAWIIFQEHRELNRLLKFYAPEAHAEFAKPKHLRGPYPPAKE